MFKTSRYCELYVIVSSASLRALRHCELYVTASFTSLRALRHCELYVIARNEAIFRYVMLSEVEESTFGTRTDPSTLLRMTWEKDCFVVPPRNDAEEPPRNDAEKPPCKDKPAGKNFPPARTNILLQIPHRIINNQPTYHPIPRHSLCLIIML